MYGVCNFIIIVIFYLFLFNGGLVNAMEDFPRAKRALSV